MGIVGRVDAIHNTPVYIGADSIEGDAQRLSDTARSTVRTNKVLSMDLLLGPAALISDGGMDGVLGIIVLPRLDLEISQYGTALDKHLVPREVADEDALNLTLGDDVQPAVPRVRLVGALEEQLLSILVDRRPFDQRPFLMDFRGHAPHG